MLTVANMSYSRNGVAILKKISFQFEKGSGAIILGANGAGKTTLIKGLAGILYLAPHSKILWDHQQFREAVDMKIGYLGHQNGLKNILTVKENLRLAAMLYYPAATKLSLEKWLEYWGLGQLADQVTQNLSAGQQRRLALARLCALESNLWLLDEPLTSLDSAAALLFQEQLDQFLKNQGIVIMSSHQLIHHPALTPFLLERGKIIPYPSAYQG